MATTEVIIPTYNGERHLGELLESLVTQSSSDYFVTVSDNGSIDRSVDLACEFQDKLDVRVVDASEKPGKAFALNKAIKMSSTPNLIFIDQDDVVNSTYVEEMTVALKGTPIVAASMDAIRLNPQFETLPRFAPRDQKLGQFTIKTVAGGTLGIRRETLDDIGMFDEGFNYSTNDVEFCCRAHYRGYDIQLVKDAVLYYRFRDTLKGNFQQGIYYGIGNFHIAQLYPEVRGDQATTAELIFSTAALAASLAFRKKGARKQAVHFIGKNIGQMREKLLSVF